MQVFDYCLISMSLASIKSMGFKTFVWVNCALLKTGKSMSDFKMKNTIGDGMKMFRIYQLAVWRSIQNLYSHFTKVPHKYGCFSRIVEPWVLNTTFNNISVISWQSVLLVEETGENHWPTLSHNAVHLALIEIQIPFIEWVIVVYCQPSNFSAISLWEHVNFQWNSVLGFS
jgi:hypothetical protein